MRGEGEGHEQSQTPSHPTQQPVGLGQPMQDSLGSGTLGRGESHYLHPSGSHSSCCWQATSASLFTYTDNSGTSSPGSAGLSQLALLRNVAGEWQPGHKAGFHSDSAEPSLFGAEKKRTNPTVPLV